jgi:sporulation protein YlmC with PRC-barrel domain
MDRGYAAMMLVGSALKGYAIEASDGRIGSVSDFLFDDKTWTIRWMVVDTGGWLPGRKVLVHPSVIDRPDYGLRQISVRLSKEKMKHSPDLLSDAPVSRQMENDLYGYYGWDPFWGGGNYFGAGYPYGMGAAFEPSPYRGQSGLLEAERRGSDHTKGDPHLRSVTELVGYHIQATDGPIGHIENLLVDDTDWDARYLIIDTKNWWPGQHVLMSPYAVRSISWSDRDVTLDVTREQVKGSPAWDPAAMVERDYESRLHGYYGWPGYGWSN